MEPPDADCRGKGCDVTSDDEEEEGSWLLSVVVVVWRVEETEGVVLVDEGCCAFSRPATAASFVIPGSFSWSCCMGRWRDG